MDLLFSVIMPVYKTEKSVIERAIASVKKQSYSNWELLIVDDNPVDSEFKDVVKSLKTENLTENLIFVIQDDNHGANVARNIGVNMSKGKWCAFIDADDEWAPYYLEKCKYIIDSNNDVGLISSSYIIVTRGRKVIVDSKLSKGNYYLQELKDDVVSPTSAVMVRREDLLSIKGFDESLPARQDYDTWLRLSRTVNFVSNSSPSVYIYRNGHESISTNYMKHVNGTLMVLKKIEKLVSKEDYIRIREYQYLHIAEYCIQYNAFDVAKDYAQKCTCSKRKIKIMLICNCRWIYVAYKLVGRKVINFLATK